MKRGINKIADAEIQNNIGKVNLIAVVILAGTIGITNFEISANSSGVDFKSTMPPLGHFFVLALLALASIYIVSEFYLEE